VFDAGHEYRPVLASFAVAMMAGFTGLSLTRGAPKLPAGRRKAVVSMSAVALGGGIWSMHFVAMLGLQLPFVFCYDALITLISALVAILITGVALLVLHFVPRSTASITGAGVITGIGIPVMHCIGMSGMELCRPVHTPLGLVLAFAASILLSMAAVWLACGERGRRNIRPGTAAFGLAVFSAHFLAMAGTLFLALRDVTAAGPAMGNESLALPVTPGAVLISAAFLLTGVTFAPETAAGVPPARTMEVPSRPVMPLPGDARIPYKRETLIFFQDGAQVAALRAPGHYTILYHRSEKLFCPWSISDAEKRLAPGFLGVHRICLINPRLVTGFERLKDRGLCFFGGVEPPLRVPVSRSHLKAVREAPGL
jgi:NO-binding membrane sensor protein with MHYT domain